MTLFIFYFSELDFEEPLCTAEWGAFPRVNKETNELIMLQFQTSFEYLLIVRKLNELLNKKWD